MIELRTLGTLDLLSSDGTDLRPLLNGPKRIALLTYLAAAAPAGFHRRDTLLAMFWPEARDSQARNSLRNTLYVLRRSLGAEVLVNRGDEEVGIAPGTVWCDVVAFREARAQDRLEAAVDLYRGEMLPGFFVSGAPEFEDWLDRERNALQRSACETAWSLAEIEERAGHSATAALLGRRAAALAPLDEEAARRLVSLLARLNDRAGALSAYDDFCHRLRSVLDSEPTAQTRALADDIRSRPPPSAVAMTPAESAPAVSTGSAAVPVDAATPTESIQTIAPRAAGWRRHGRSFGIAAIVLLLSSVLGIGSWRVMRAPALPARLILAVGPVQAFGEEYDSGLSRVLPDMLSTSLARADVLRVISNSRLYEVLARLGEGASLAAAAREVGAQELLEGNLVRTEDGLLRLDLRRVDLHSGELRAVYQAKGTDPFVLVDRATAELLEAFGVSAPVDGIAAVSTSSLPAYRFYEEGMRAYYEGDDRAAERMFTAALAEDSIFAMAAYYRAQSRRTSDHAGFREDLHRAARLAGRASDRERLLIRSAWAQAMDDPTQLALADSLVARFPTEPEGHLFLGKATFWGGAFLAALPHLRRAVAMDSLSLRGETLRCMACDALNDIVSSYMLADSLPAAEREARGWTTAQPGSARAWHALASTLEYQGSLAAAQAARDRAALLRSGNPRDPLYPVVLALRAGDFQRADRLLGERLDGSQSLVQQNVLWYRVLSLRSQGRLLEALPAARQYRRMVHAATTTGHPPIWAAVLEAQVLLELGRVPQSVALWREMAASQYEPDSPSRTARHQAWTLTHAASASAASGDTLRLAALADTIEGLGRRSAYGRDPRLHHFVRGLLLSARGDSRGAADEHQRAIFSTTSGYGRINLELGRALLANGQARQAAEVAGAALRGPLDAANLYVDRAELHELSGLAWEAAGLQDSAAVHYRWVVNAWQNADPSFAARREILQLRLARLGN
jgi:DNA-binding SARP family transcriptional activator